MVAPDLIPSTLPQRGNPIVKSSDITFDDGWFRNARVHGGRLIVNETGAITHLRIDALNIRIRYVRQHLQTFRLDPVSKAKNNLIQKYLFNCAFPGLP